VFRMKLPPPTLSRKHKCWGNSRAWPSDYCTSFRKWNYGAYVCVVYVIMKLIYSNFLPYSQNRFIHSNFSSIFWFSAKKQRETII